MNEVEPKKSPMKWIEVGAAIGIIIIAFAVVAYTFLLPFVNRPKPDIRQLEVVNLGELNYFVYVKVGVKNDGGDGWVRAYVELEGAGKYEEKTGRIHLASGEVKSLTLVFDVGFWNITISSMTCEVRAVAD